MYVLLILTKRTVQRKGRKAFIWRFWALLLHLYSAAHESILTNLLLLEHSMPREKVDVTTCRVRAGLWRQLLPVPWKWAVVAKDRRKNIYIFKKSPTSFPSTRPLGRGNADPPAHRWNKLLVCTPWATSSAGGGFWRRHEGHEPPSCTAHARGYLMGWNAALPTDPSPAMTTSHTAGEEAVGWAHTSQAIKVIFLISTSPSHPVTGHRKY